MKWIFRLIALLIVPLTADAVVTYEIRTTCGSRGIYGGGELLEDLGCPSKQLRGGIIMPDAYVPGTVARWNTEYQDTDLQPIDFWLEGEIESGSYNENTSGSVLLPERVGRMSLGFDWPAGGFAGGGDRWSFAYEAGYGQNYLAIGGPMRAHRVPEPGTLALLGLGLAGLGLSRRRKAN